MVKLLHLSDIHLGSGFSHGRINPVTGWNTRLEDFTAALARCIDRALAEPVDLVLFGGDAFPDATPPPRVQEAFAGQFCRLADAGIPAVLLVGNHDQYAQGSGGVSLSIYRTLGVPGFVVGDTLALHRIETAAGPVQVITLPWLTRSALLTKPETEGLSLAAVAQLLIDRLSLALEGEIRALDPDLPSILLAHLMSDRARLGAERFLGVGKGFSIPLSSIARPEFDYVALGHVHSHQNLNPNHDPPVIYPGSLERVDFSEEGEAKGYVLVEIDRPVSDPETIQKLDLDPSEHSSQDSADRSQNSLENSSKNRQRTWRTTWQFCELNPRPFRTIRVDVTQETEPTAALLAAIDRFDLTEAVVRLIYRLQPEQLPDIDLTALRDRLANQAHSYTIHTDLVSQLARPRLPELATASLDPLVALEAYLGSRSDLADLAADMLTAAQDLLGYANPAIAIAEDLSEQDLAEEDSLQEELDPENLVQENLVQENLVKGDWIQENLAPKALSETAIDQLQLL